MSDRKFRKEPNIHHTGEPGSATVVILGVMAMILALVGVLSGIGRVVHQQQDLQDRADLAALAVAHTFRHTGSEQIACRKGRRLVGNLEMMCSVDGDSSRIITRAELTIGMIPIELEATARAGPYLLGVDD